MAVEEGTIEVTPTGDQLDTTKVTKPDGTVAHREVVVLGDPETLESRVGYEKRYAGSAYAMPAEDVDRQRTINHQIRVEELLEQIVIYLEAM